MSAQPKPIRGQLMRMVLMTSAAVLLLTIASLFAYEFATFRQASREQLDTLGKAIAANSTAALAFANRDDAEDVLQAFDADPHIVAAALYDKDGQLFAVYPRNIAQSELPAQLPNTPVVYRFEGAHLIGFQPVLEAERRMGTLFVKSDLRAIDARVRFYLGVLALIVAASGALAYFISRPLQHRIARPILELAKTASAVSTQRDYSVRAQPANVYELDQLTDAFNHMLTEIQHNEGRLRTQLGHLSLLQHITRAVSERQDLASILQVVIKSLEENLPIDFGCVCRHDAASGTLLVATVGSAGALADSLAMQESTPIPVAANGLTRCIEGQLVYETDARKVPFPLFERFATAGLRSVVIAPLRAESTIFGALIVTRRVAEGFTSADCEFLKQLSEHVGLASQQAQLNGALQQAYDDLRQSQHTVMQQERLRALGQMASGIAHDINNAISPVALYTESLLEREPNLSERSRSYLTTIQRAIEDVAGTVARMREFYRQREPQLSLARIDLNRTIEQAIELTHARWSDLPQQRGVMIELRTERSPAAAEVMAAEGEVRDALTNLIFNAVDAMPEGGTLTIRTRVVDPLDADGTRRVFIEVSDTGIGMDEATRRRCLEPFFTTKGERGSGLGLAMVYGMVQRHSAELEVDSEPGRGTTFRLIFPASAQDAPSVSYQPAAHPVTQRLRLLVVDDDPMLIRSLEDILTSDGHIVTVASGGQAGIDAFTAAAKTSEPFALVITDLGMPHVDGRRVAAAIKAVSAKTPIIMLTGWGQRLVAENDIPPHVNRVLNKPPRLAELRAALFDLTAERGQSDARAHEVLQGA
jgi:signal transduction histidine kinase/ActR/RegA family two-component response regulator